MRISEQCSVALLRRARALDSAIEIDASDALASQSRKKSSLSQRSTCIARNSVYVSNPRRYSHVPMAHRGYATT
jgi:hypothetical protein